ncbi:MAG: hypothetical protein K0R31_1200, partial [Clostridiales bacterium]|nr:hypothetical protein [Clostridiales bacterium]
MNKLFKYSNILSVLLSLVILTSCSNNTAPQAVTDSKKAENIVSNANAVTSAMVTYENDDFYSEWKDQNPNYITLNGSSASLTGSGAKVEGGKITITAGGVYTISGKLDNGQIVVDVQDKGTVKLVLNGMEIKSTDNAPIYVKNAGKTIISLQE